MLPTFEGFQLSAESPKSSLKVSIHQSPGDPALAVWFHGALPTVKVEGPALCFLYSISIPLKNKGHYLPWVLTLPDETASLNRLRQLLQEWVTETANRSISQLFLPCLLDNHYDSYDAITGRDAILRDKLLLLAKELGLQFYCAGFKRKVSGRAQGWCEHRGWSQYDYPERHDADHDSNGGYIIDDDYPQETSWSLNNLYDIVRNKALQFGEDKPRTSYPYKSTQNITPDYKLDEGEVLIIAGNLDFTTADLEFSEEYDSYDDGQLFQSWSRTALLLWYPGVHGKLLVKLCGWDAALLLTPPIDLNGGGAGVPVEPDFDPAMKMAIAEELVLKDVNAKHASYKASTDEARLCLLKFALETKRKDIFLATLTKLPPANPWEQGLVLLLKQASDLFLDCSGRNSKNDEIVATAVGDYAKTVKWISFLRVLKEKGADISLYLARVAEAHTCNFHPQSTAQSAASLETDIFGYPCGFPVPTPATPGMLPANIPTATDSPTFIALKFALECGNDQVIALLLKQIAHTLPLAPTATTATGSNNAYADFILLIYNLMASNASGGSFTPRLPPTIQHFFLFMVLKHLLPPLGAPPFVPHPGDKRPPNLALQPVACKTKCTDCLLLSAFLTSCDQQKWDFSAGVLRKRHLAAQLDFTYVDTKNVVAKEVALRPGVKATHLEVLKVGLTWTERRQQWNNRREELGVKVGKLLEFFSAEVDAGMQEWRTLIKNALGPQGMGWDMTLSIAAQQILALPWPEPGLLGGPQNALNRGQAPIPAQQPTPPKTGNVVVGLKRKIGSDEPENGELVGGSGTGAHAVKKRWNVIDLTESDTEEAAMQPAKPL